MKLKDLFKKLQQIKIVKGGSQMELKELLSKYDNRSQIRKWVDMYEGKNAWLDDGTPLESKGLVNFSAVLVSKIAELALLEIESKIVGNGVIKEVNQSYQDFLSGLRSKFEILLTQGGGIIKPIIEEVKDNYGEVIKRSIDIEYITADKFIPIRFNNKGELISVAFLDVVEHKKKFYTRVEIHELNGEEYTIDNQAYYGNIHIEEVSKKVSLSTVPEWTMDPYVSITGIKKPFFIYVRTPFANNQDITSPLGVSVFSKNEKLLRDAEVMYDRIQWEYEATEIAIDASQDFFVNMRGNQLLSSRARAFRLLDTEDKNFYEVFSPEIRDESLFNGLNKILRRIESNVGLSYGTLSEVDTIEKTAEEIKAGRETTYITIKGLQSVLETSLESLVDTIIMMLGVYENKSIEDNYEFLIHFDDSVVIDRQADLMYQEVKDKIINKETYIMRRYGVSKKEALEMMG